jgi:ABC-type branched-subunit amino acid transport system ATPase component
VSERVLDARALTVRRGGAPVVNDIDLHVDAGEVVILLGRNGAGKSTTLLACAGHLPAESGEVRLFGRRVRAGAPHRLVRSGLAFVPDDRALARSLTVAEHLRLAQPGRSRADAMLDLLPVLAAARDRPAGLLSGGQQQMLALARALIRRPRALIIDELSLGLAMSLVPQLLVVIRDAAADGTGVLLVEQHASLALAAADRAVLLERGRVVAAGPAPEVAARPDLLASTYLGPSRRV